MPIPGLIVSFGNRLRMPCLYWRLDHLLRALADYSGCPLVQLGIGRQSQISPEGFSCR
jgi:hypothetical protein